MRYRLGLDMGTNSIGFAVIELSKENHPIELVDMGVRIFHDGRNPKDKQPLAVARRIARGMRRQRDRKKQRKRQILRSLVDNGLFPSSEEEKNTLKALDPYALRVEALDRRLTEYELGRALLHLGTRRGFKSNRVTDEISNEESTTSKKLSQADMISNLSLEMNSIGARTIGEYLFKRIQIGCGARFRGGGFNCYPSREHYVQEFNAIKESQSKFYPNIDWDSIYSAIFFQRPLRKQERGKCRFYTDKERAYSALPSAQRFRILSDINNLKFSDSEGNVLTLTEGEKERLFKSLDNCKSMLFSKVRKTLSLNSSCKFSIEDDRRDKLIGNETSFLMRKPENFGPAWDDLTIEVQDSLVDSLLEAETDDEVLEMLDNFNLRDCQKEKILKLKFSRKVGSLSLEFMRDCSRIMEMRHVRYDEAVASMNLHHSFNPNETLLEELPYYGQILSNTVMGAHPEADDSNLEYKYGKIANPTVHIALNQLRKVVNSLIQHYGKPEQVVVELSRDISNSAEKRTEYYRKQVQKEKENDRIRGKIRELGILNPTAFDIKKYKLWEELGKDSNVRRCPYCGKVIPASRLFTKEIEIEHILPYSRTMLGSMSNLTLAHSHCNHEKTNLTPYEAFSSSPDGFIWSEIVSRAENFPAAKRAKFTKDAIAKFDEDEGFISRQLNDNRYISKAAKEYLACICPYNHIWGITGSNTAILRSRWGLNKILNKNKNQYVKNRSDHRHHSLDAVVIGLTDRRMVKEMAELNKAYDSVARLQAPRFPFDMSRVEHLLRKMVVSYKLEHGYQSRFFKETATGLKHVKTSIRVSELKEQMVRENLVVSEKLNVKLNADLDKGKQFKLLQRELIEKARILQKTEDPLIDVYKKVWVTRVSFVDLTDKDIQEERIFNQKIQRYVKDNTLDVISDKKALKERLESLSNTTGIKRVRYVPNNQEYARIMSVPNKWYERDGVCFASVWSIPRKGKSPVFQGRFVSYKEAYEHATGKLKEFSKPHSAARKVMTLYKDDLIRIEPKNGELPYYALCSSFSTTNNKIDLRPMFAAEKIDSWIEHTNPQLIPDLPVWSDKKGSQNYVSINALFKENNVSVVKVSPDGRVEHQ